MEFLFVCKDDNDLYKYLSNKRIKCHRYDDISSAIGTAQQESSLLILADRYPDYQTNISNDIFNYAKLNNIRLYIEYPDAMPGYDIENPIYNEWERAAISSDAFGPELHKLSILALHDCHYIRVKADDPLIVISRIAGYDKAIFGLPNDSSPILFKMKDQNALIATTKLSGFITGRFAPRRSINIVWEYILNFLEPTIQIEIDPEPAVHPAYDAKYSLPAGYERETFKSASKWFRNSRLLISDQMKKEIDETLGKGIEHIYPPKPDESIGDGSCGFLEGYSSSILWNGEQIRRVPLRNDCNAEAAMVFGIDWLLNNNNDSKIASSNLLDFIYEKSEMCKGGRGNPKHPAFGHVAWGAGAPAWLIANYGDDSARGLLGTLTAAASIKSDRWNKYVMRSLLANLRTTGKLGFRTDRIDMPDLEKNGWKYYYDSSPVSYAPHFEAYLWACNLWAYQQTGYIPFIERTKIAIRMTMEAYPDQWRWKDSIERARMLLPLAWLVRIEDNFEHREWLRKVTADLISIQDSCGALRELVNETGGGGHYFAPKSNEAYGTGETPLIQENGDPASDQLYTTGFALLGLHEAYAATGDIMYNEAEEKLTEFLCRIQIKSTRFPYLDGAWFRAFDYKKWEYWASSGDAGWGVWSIESGWCNAWTAAIIGLRIKQTSVWDLISLNKIEDQLDNTLEEMKQNNGDPWKE